MNLFQKVSEFLIGLDLFEINSFSWSGMDRRMIGLRFGSNIYYVECFDNETIGDIKLFLIRKYHFENDDNLEILQDNDKLPSNQKVMLLQNKNNLVIQGNIKAQILEKTDQGEIESPEKNILENYGTMGFEEPDEVILQLLSKYNYNQTMVITQLLVAKRKALKSKA